jgi:hypothetical protein
MQRALARWVLLTSVSCPLNPEKRNSLRVIGVGVEFTLFYVQPLDTWNVPRLALVDFKRVVARGGSG